MAEYADMNAGETFPEPELCRRCGRNFAAKGGLCDACRREISSRRAKRAEPGAVSGEERYRAVPPEGDGSNFSEEALDTVENVGRCLTCEIPQKYCTGSKCVAAYRRWQAHVKSQKRKDRIEKDREEGENER